MLEASLDKKEPSEEQIASDHEAVLNWLATHARTILPAAAAYGSYLNPNSFQTQVIGRAYSRA
jgi:hypothetical protein